MCPCALYAAASLQRGVWVDSAAVLVAGRAVPVALYASHLRQSFHRGGRDSTSKVAGESAVARMLSINPSAGRPGANTVQFFLTIEALRPPIGIGISPAAVHLDATAGYRAGLALGKVQLNLVRACSSSTPSM
jgi:hypothetical protein